MCTGDGNGIVRDCPHKTTYSHDQRRCSFAAPAPAPAPAPAAAPAPAFVPAAVEA